MAEKDKPTEPDAAKKAAEPKDIEHTPELEEILRCIPENIDSIRKEMSAAFRAALTGHEDNIENNMLNDRLFNPKHEIELTAAVENIDDLQKVIVDVHNYVLENKTEAQAEFRRKIFAVLQPHKVENSTVRSSTDAVPRAESRDEQSTRNQNNTVNSSPSNQDAPTIFDEIKTIWNESTIKWMFYGFWKTPNTGREGPIARFMKRWDSLTKWAEDSRWNAFGTNFKGRPGNWFK